jgi:tetratricopeptide (TPR) repeat protein
MGFLVVCCSGSVEDRFKQGIGLLFENRYEEAESLYLAIASELKSSPQPDAVRMQARALYQAAQIEHLYLNQPRRAVARFHEALKIDPEAPFAFDAQREIVTIYQERLMDYRAAVEEIERLVSVFPLREDIVEYQYRGAQCYFLLRDFNQARVEAKVLLQKKDHGAIAALARLLIANSFSVEGRYPEAIEAYRELLDSNPDPELRARAQFELGLCYQELGDIPKAEKALLEALKKHPRPDLVQAQLSNLRERFSELDAPKRSGSQPAPKADGPVPKTKPKAAPLEKPALAAPKASPVSTSATGSDPATKTLAPGAPPTKPERPEAMDAEKQPQAEKNSRPSAPESPPVTSTTSSNGG